MSREQFLAWDDTQGERFGFDGYGAVPILAATPAHGAITRNLIGQLWLALRGRPCQVYGGDVCVDVAGRLRAPHAVVTCTVQSPGHGVTREPVVVFEVMSASTAMTDTTTKNSDYRATPSVHRYVMLDQTRVAALVFAREGAGWVGSLREDSEVVLSMPEIGVSLRLGDLYEGVSFAPPAN